MLSQRVERDTRDEVYLSLLGKSQTFHGRQRVGDLMARVTNDVQQISQLVSPGLGLMIESVLTLLVPLIAIASLQVDLLLVPLVFLVAVTFALRRYNRQLRPVAGALRERFGVMNAGLAEAVAGIEVVKGFAQEAAGAAAFRRAARSYRDSFVREGEVQARSLPLLLYGIAVGLAFGHALLLFLNGRVSGRPGDHLYGAAGEPAHADQFPADDVLGGAAEHRQRATHPGADQDRDRAGRERVRRQQADRGEIVFEHVSFGYSGEALASAAGNGAEQPSTSLGAQETSRFMRGRARRSRSSGRPARARRR